MVFIPLSVFFSLQVLMYLGILIANMFTYVNENAPLLFFFEGMLDCPCCFLMYFLIPLKIATHYRHTAEVTPAATVIATSISFTYFLSTTLYHILCRLIELLLAVGASTLITNGTPLILVSIGLMIVRG